MIKHPLWQKKIEQWQSVEPINNESKRWSEGAAYCLFTARDCENCENFRLLGLKFQPDEPVFIMDPKKRNCKMPHAVQKLINQGEDIPSHIKTAVSGFIFVVNTHER